MSKKYIISWSLIATALVLFSIFQMTQASRINLFNQNSGCGPLSQEAEQGQLLGQMQIGQDAKASGGQFVYAPKVLDKPAL